tara:strand:- start:247 stop:504 length:258 start_codon:yes stop_codon:yes gene_type:complete
MYAETNDEAKSLIVKHIEKFGFDDIDDFQPGKTNSINYYYIDKMYNYKEKEVERLLSDSGRTQQKYNPATGRIEKITASKKTDDE